MATTRAQHDRRTVATTSRRRAVSYVYFLSTMLLVAVIGVSAMMMARIRMKSGQRGDCAIAARFYAESAIELGYIMISLDPDWRSNVGTIASGPIGHGTMILRVTTLDDGDMNPRNDSAVLIGIGIEGESRHQIRVKLDALSDNGGMVFSSGGGRRDAS